MTNRNPMKEAKKQLRQYPTITTIFEMQDLRKCNMTTIADSIIAQNLRHKK